MARYLAGLQYLDELVAVLGALDDYHLTHDAAALADDVTAVVLDMARQHLGTDPSPLVDEEALRQAVVLLVEALAPILGGEA